MIRCRSATSGRIRPTARMRERDIEGLADAARTRRHHHHPVRQEDRLLDIMGDHCYGDALMLPEPQQFFLEARPRERIQHPQRLVEQQQSGPRAPARVRLRPAATSPDNR